MMNSSFLWVEKYAPQTIEECILPPTLKKEFQEIVDSQELSNMLFIGDAGVGKTTVAKVLCEQLDLDMMFMNASCERGIDDVRVKIQSFASTTSLYGSYKVVLLDEADNLTPDAQKSLRALIEQFQNNCRFVLTCNYPYKLIDPLRSRLQEYIFSYPTKSKSLGNEFTKRVIDILVKEEIKLKEEDIPILKDLISLYYPNWRKVLHELQRCCKSGVVDHTLVNKVKEQHISSLFELLKIKNFTKVREWVEESLTSGVESSEVVNLIYTHMKEHLVPSSLPQCVLVLADYQHRSSVVANQAINTTAMCVEIMMAAEFKG